MADFALILPCYNPLSGWSERVVASMLDLKTRIKGRSIQLVLVHDASTTPSFEDEIEALRKALPDALILEHTRNQGKGAALRTGFRKAHAKSYVFTDIDFPYEMESLAALMTKLDSPGAPAVAVGQRSPEYYKSVPFFRKLLSRSFRLFLRYWWNLRVTDTQCGLKGFSETGKELFLKTRTERYLVDLEFLCLASQLSDMRIEPVSVRLRSGVTFSKMSWPQLRHELKTLFQILFMEKGVEGWTSSENA